jgi:hypothetical protein
LILFYSQMTFTHDMIGWTVGGIPCIHMPVHSAQGASDRNPLLLTFTLMYNMVDREIGDKSSCIP